MDIVGNTSRFVLKDRKFGTKGKCQIHLLTCSALKRQTESLPSINSQGYYVRGWWQMVANYVNKSCLSAMDWKGHPVNSVDALECHFSESLTSPESLTFTNSSVNLRFNKRFRRLPLWISGSKFSLSVCSPFKKALILLRNSRSF